VVANFQSIAWTAWQAAKLRSQASSKPMPCSSASSSASIASPWAMSAARLSAISANAGSRKHIHPLVETWAEGEGEMTMPRPQQWTEAEVHRLRMLAKRKVSADSIAKLLGRYVGSVKIKARELSLILSRKVKAKGK
jgi:hypothetical protein